MDEERTVGEILDDIAAKMCDDYCKYPNLCKSEEALDMICDECPLNRACIEEQ